VTGYTTSFDFPHHAYAQAKVDNNQGSNYNIFVSMLNVARTALLYSSYLGGGLDDLGQALALDQSGNVYVGGYTASTDFPTTAGAYQGTYSPGTGYYVGFVAKLNLSLSGSSSLLYSTYVGGTSTDGDTKVYGLAVDGAGNASVTGQTTSSAATFPLLHAYQTSLQGTSDAFLITLNAQGSALVYASYLGGTSANGSSDDWAQGIAVDGAGNVYLSGSTQSATFPHTSGAFQTSFQGPAYGNDAFVSELNPKASGTSSLVYSTFLGGATNSDWAPVLALDSAGNVYVEGSTQSTDFPLQNPVQSTLTSGTSCTSPPCADAFVARLNQHASGRAALLFSTYLGGGDTDFGQGLAVDGAGNMYLTGQTYSTDFPTTPGALQGSNGGWYDAFIAKISGPPLNLGRAGMPTPRSDLAAALGPDNRGQAGGG